MILKGSQRGSAMQLARHLLNARDNDHIELHEMRGFVSDSLPGAFKEIQAVARGTRCEQFLFSLSLSPPETESVPTEVFDEAIEAIERKLGLTGQPRAVLFHEKRGRRHAHCVWSRIDAAKMKAINLPHFKRKLQDIARDLYREHRWQMPSGFLDHKQRDPLTYDQAEGQQAARTKQDPQSLKLLFRQCWEQSDTRTAFAAALREHGLVLAMGDRRGFVAVDRHGEIYSVSRWTGVKAREVRAKLGNNTGLPSVEEAKQQLAHFVSDDLEVATAEIDTAYKEQLSKLETERLALIAEQRKVRSKLKADQQERLNQLIRTHHQQLPTGLKAAWLKLSGRYQTFLDTNESAVRQRREEDRATWQCLMQSQLQERLALEQRWRRILADHALATDQLRRETGAELGGQCHLFIDPAQPLIIPPDEQESAAAARVRRNPAAVLEIINDKKEFFTRGDIARALAKYIDDPADYCVALDVALASKDLVKTGAKDHYTTRDMVAVKARLSRHVDSMIDNASYGVRANYVDAAIRRHNKKLQREAGASLSEEQTNAIRHVLDPPQLSVVVGLAGAGKSTMLDAAREVWEQQGYQVVGAALAGKAADGLEQSSGIKSRTLASLEHSIDCGMSPLTSRTVLVIDEAGMIGTRQLERITRQVEQAGAKLVLVGDPNQLQPIQAGTPFRTIVEDQPVARLTEIRRQKDAWQREAVRDLAEGRVGKALQAFDDNGCVSHRDDQDSAIAALVDDYVKDMNNHGDTKSRLALAYRRKDVHAINQGIRAKGKLAGNLQNEVLIQTDEGPRAFAIGDRIVLTRNDRTLGLRNGMLGTVEMVNSSEITVNLDGDHERTISIPTNYCAFDHGYATTIHKSQGATVDDVFLLHNRQMDHHLTYVALSRQKSGVVLYSRTRTKEIEEYFDGDRDGLSSGSLAYKNFTRRIRRTY